MGGRAWVTYKPSKREIFFGWLFGHRENKNAWKLPIHRTYK